MFYLRRQVIQLSIVECLLQDEHNGNKLRVAPTCCWCGRGLIRSELPSPSTIQHSDTAVARRWQRDATIHVLVPTPMVADAWVG